MFFKVNMSAGVYFTGKNDDLRIGSSHFLPIADLPGKNPSQLIQRKLRNRILWVYHNREAVQGDGILSWFNAFFLSKLYFFGLNIPGAGGQIAGSADKRRKSGT